MRTPNIVKSVAAAIERVDSVHLRTAVQGEFDRASSPPVKGRDATPSERVHDPIDQRLPEPLPEPIPEGLAEGLGYSSTSNLHLQPPPPPRSRAADDFDEFWRRYPRKVARAAAMKAWNKLDDVKRARAIAVIDAHRAHWRAEHADTDRYIPHASTWLNGRRFDDDPPAVNGDDPPDDNWPSGWN
jgi:hypothetical protein